MPPPVPQELFMTARSRTLIGIFGLGSALAACSDLSSPATRQPAGLASFAKGAAGGGVVWWRWRRWRWRWWWWWDCGGRRSQRNVDWVRDSSGLEHRSRAECLAIHARRRRERKPQRPSAIQFVAPSPERRKLTDRFRPRQPKASRSRVRPPPSSVATEVPRPCSPVRCDSASSEAPVLWRRMRSTIARWCRRARRSSSPTGARCPTVELRTQTRIPR